MPTTTSISSNNDIREYAAKIIETTRTSISPSIHTHGQVLKNSEFIAFLLGTGLIGEIVRRIH